MPGSRGRTDGRIWTLDRCMSIGYTALERRFGRGKFRKINAELGMFEVTTNWSTKKHLTRGYRLTEPVRKLKERYLAPRGEALTRLTTMDGNALRTLPIRPMHSSSALR
jgi:hypothetical protein